MSNSRTFSFVICLVVIVALLFAYFPGPKKTSHPEFMEILWDLRQQTNVKFRVFKIPDPMVNAYVMPPEEAQYIYHVPVDTGAIVITQGLLDNVSPDIFAVILGHEIGHVKQFYPGVAWDITAEQFYHQRFHAIPHDPYTYTEAAADIMGMKLAGQAGYKYSDYPAYFREMYRFVDPPYVSLTMAREAVIRNYIEVTTNFLYRKFWR